MVSKDQTIGAFICLVSAIIAIAYIIFLFYPDPLVTWFNSLGWGVNNYLIRLWLVAIPVLIASVAVLAIGAWIGWTMATTPPPRPIEEIEAEMEEEEPTS